MTQAQERGGRAGFNLIELMLVVAIIGIVMAAAAPSFSQRSAWYRMDGAARSLASRMLWARQKAVATRTPYRMTIDREAMTYYFERQDNDSTWTPDPDDTYEMEGIADFEAEINGSTTNDDIQFQTQGTIDNDDVPTTMRIFSTQGDTCSLSVVRTGRVTIRSAGGSNE